MVVTLYITLDSCLSTLHAISSFILLCEPCQGCHENCFLTDKQTLVKDAMETCNCFLTDKQTLVFLLS